MLIGTVRIQNFRTLHDVTISFDAITTFIGPNGTGKSTVLRALDWFFNGKPGALGETDCSFGAVAEDIEVRVTFTDLTDADRDALGKYAPEAANTFTAWKIRRPDGSETVSANAKSFADFNAIRAAAGAAEKKRLYSDLRSSTPDLALPAAATGAAVEEAMMVWEAAHTDLLLDAPEGLPTNFFGFNSGGKMSGLFDFVLVPADLRASEEAVDGRGSIISRILERSVDRTAADEEIAKIVEESRSKQQKIYGEKFETQLAGVRSRLDAVIDRYAPGRTISVRPAELELKAPRTTFDVAVIDGEAETAVDRQGHGFQRTLLISALQVLAESGAAASDGVICLAIEEPELFQHPIQARTFAKVLRALAEDGDKRVQVTYATHSPYFVEARHFDQVRRLVRSDTIPPRVSVHFATVDKVNARISGAIDPDSVRRQLDGAVSGELSVALFASRALILEGTTDAAVLYAAADRDAIGGLEARGVTIVAVSGKSSIPLSHAVLSEIGIPTYALIDADAGFADRSRAKNQDEETILKQRDGHAKANRKLLGYFGKTAEDFPVEAVLDDLAIFEDTIETFLEKEWPEWRRTFDAAEVAAGIPLAKNQLAYRTVTLDSDGVVPAVLDRILKKAQGLDDE